MSLDSENTPDRENFFPDFVELSRELINLKSEGNNETDEFNTVLGDWIGLYFLIDRFNIQFVKDKKAEEYIIKIMNSQLIKPNWEFSKELAHLTGISPECANKFREEWWAGLLVGNDWNDQYQRYFQLIPPFVREGTDIPENIISLYAETRWCYIFAQFNACIALCRALVESIAKEVVGQKIGLDLKGGSEGSDLQRCLFLLEKIKYISSSCAQETRIYLVKNANLVMHEGKLPSEENALNAIEITRHFLEEIYIKKPFISN